MKEPATIILKSGKDQSLKRMHPWIFSGAIKKIKGNVAEGDLVKVISNHDEYLGSGHFQPGSIAVRILTFGNEEINESFWFKKISEAYNYRVSTGIAKNNETNVFRLINAEGDGLPGLIVDYYNGTAVIQMHSVGMLKNIDHIVKGLKNALGNNLIAVYNKSESTLPFKAEEKSENGYLFGKREDNIVLEYGNKFEINWEEGQKTGFFIDQRENRRLVGNYSEGKKVLNVFCYTGGFSVYALQGKAKMVHSVDSSKPAIDLTNKNIAHNFNDPVHESYCTDAFNFLDNMGNDYDLVILDPPAFAKHGNVLSNALQGYKRLNMKALSKIKKGGILFTFSCSQVVDKENFRKSVFAASANTGRNVRILHQLSQPVDHPVNIYHPEGEYLKGLVLYVE